MQCCEGDDLKSSPSTMSSQMRNAADPRSPSRAGTAFRLPPIHVLTRPAAPSPPRKTHRPLPECTRRARRRFRRRCFSRRAAHREGRGVQPADRVLVADLEGDSAGQHGVDLDSRIANTRGSNRSQSSCRDTQFEGWRLECWVWHQAVRPHSSCWAAIPATASCYLREPRRPTRRRVRSKRIRRRGGGDHTDIPPSSRQRRGVLR